MNALTLPGDVARLIESQRRQLDAVAPGHRRRLRAIAKRLERKLGRQLERLGRDSFSAQQTRVKLLQIQAVTDSLAVEYGDAVSQELVELARQAAGIGRQGLVAEIQAWAKHYKGAKRSVVRTQLAGDLLGDGLLEFYQSSRERYGADALRRMRAVMAEGALAGETVAQTSDKLARVMRLKQYQAERIVRTEQSRAWHFRKLEDAKAMAEDEPGWQKMATGPMDGRTGEDSKEIEGQLRGLDQPFQSPQHGTFQAPPDRVNDRGTMVLVPPEGMF